MEGASVDGTLADGIVTAGLVGGTMTPATQVTITGNLAKDNEGSGIDLNSTSYSSAVGNRSTGNAVGINVSDNNGLGTAETSAGSGVILADPGVAGTAEGYPDTTGIYLGDASLRYSAAWGL